MAGNMNHIPIASLVIFLTPVLVSAQEKVTLRMKPQTEAVSYWMRSQERQEREYPGPEMRPALYDTLELLDQTSGDASEGRIQVSATVRVKTQVINNDAIPPESFTERRIDYQIDSRGRMVGADAAADMAAQLWPTFPEEAIAPGHAWTIETTPTKDFPFSIKMTHTFTGIETVLDARCAMIESQGELPEQATASGLQFACSVQSRVAIDLDAGWIVRSVSHMTTMMRYPEAAADGHVSLRRSSVKILQQVREGDIPPPSENLEEPTGEP